MSVPEAWTNFALRCCPVCSVKHDWERDRRFTCTGPAGEAFICRCCGAVYVPKPPEPDEEG